MNILAISGSSRIGTTNQILEAILSAAESDAEIVNLKDLNINPCLNCKACHTSLTCAQNDDMKKLIPRLVEADVIILGSPTYFDNVSGIMKNFMDRCLPFYFSRQLAGKRTILITSAGFGEYLEYDDNGNCKWCAEGNECENSALRCIEAMKNFANILEMEIVDTCYSFHGDPGMRKAELISIGKKLK